MAKGKGKGQSAMNSARKGNGFTQSPSAKAPKSMSEHRASNGFTGNKGK